MLFNKDVRNGLADVISELVATKRANNEVRTIRVIYEMLVQFKSAAVYTQYDQETITRLVAISKSFARAAVRGDMETAYELITGVADWLRTPSRVQQVWDYIEYQEQIRPVMRSLQDRIIELAINRGYEETVTLSGDIPAITIADLRSYIYPKFHSELKNVLARLESQNANG
jgi:hypothetical protein